VFDCHLRRYRAQLIVGEVEKWTARRRQRNLFDVLNFARFQALENRAVFRIDGNNRGAVSFGLFPEKSARSDDGLFVCDTQRAAVFQNVHRRFQTADADHTVDDAVDFYARKFVNGQNLHERRFVLGKFVPCVVVGNRDVARTELIDLLQKFFDVCIRAKPDYFERFRVAFANLQRLRADRTGAAEYHDLFHSHNIQPLLVFISVNARDITYT